jgi:CDP-diacylglycerol--serine O-phosphatidyltransferase
MISGICDTLDGRVANLKQRTDREKSYGIQIDAFADIISFGALPAAIGYAVGESFGSFGVLSIVIFAIYVLGALIRLAYFNVIEIELHGKNEKRTYYEGLPVTIVALIIPVVYSICNMFAIPLAPAYNILLLILAAAFVMKVKIHKPKGIFKVILCLFGVPILIYILFAGGL